MSGASCVAGSGKKVGRTGNTCLANHCNNDTKDSTETSTDCGGECGCRATFDTISVKGLPANRTAFYALAMSGDGKRLAGTLTQGRLSYPGAMVIDGAVTALSTEEGNARAISSDGKVVLGQLLCADPPTCSDKTVTTVTWTGSAGPNKTGTYGNPRDLSGSGGLVVGDDYDTTSGNYYGFYKPAGKNTSTITAIALVVGVTPDGQYVVGNGNSPSNPPAALWAAQTGNVTIISSSGWSNIHADAINGVSNDPTVVGDAYVSATDSRVGFRWKGGVITELATLSGGNFISPKGVSADGGTVVGTTNDSAFIWTDAAKLRSVVDELRARGLEPAVDFMLGASSFLALSDDGKTIVGSETENVFWRVVLQ